MTVRTTRTLTKQTVEKKLENMCRLNHSVVILFKKNTSITKQITGISFLFQIVYFTLASDEKMSLEHFQNVTSF